jgi:hypothetical protein
MSSLHHVVNAVASVHQKVDNNIVTLKHQGAPIKLQPLAVVINNPDVEHIDMTGAAELRQEREPSDRRKALSHDGNNDVFTLLPPLTKSKLEAKGMHTQSPSDSPLGTKNLFPDFDHKDTLARIVRLEDRLETIQNQMAQILSILHSSLPKVPLPATPTSAPLSETPSTPEKSQPSSPVPIAWNGINSQIKIAASSTTPVKPPTSPSVKPTNNPSPKAHGF